MSFYMDIRDLSSLDPSMRTVQTPPALPNPYELTRTDLLFDTDSNYSLSNTYLKSPLYKVC